MAVFKCKMCGGSLEISDGITVCECEYCGTKQTLPKINDDQKVNLFNRASHFRQQCEFDKAAEIYEKMAAESGKDAELFWSIVLCRYGIEYVDDPVTKNKIPTCHRTQYKSILEDPDYLTALDCADTMQRNVYEREAKIINNIQKGILEISNKEDPFDVFICYKETDANGRRTADSVLAQDLYYGLVQEGFKVFFSRITLESKLGTEYEPYIFAALNSAKVMVVVGTKPEYFNAVWVRNEWSRYLQIMQKDKNRILIPAYRDMDPYDLPNELSLFQSQDMSKIGFLQDLIRGIKKITGHDNAAPAIQEKQVIREDVSVQGEISSESGKKNKTVVYVLAGIIALLCISFGILFGVQQKNKGSKETLEKESFSADNTNNGSSDLNENQNNIDQGENGQKNISDNDQITDSDAIDNSNGSEAENLTLEVSDELVEVGAGSDRSRKILMNYLPVVYNDMSTDSSIVMGNEKFDENSFSICDIDSDGEAELLVKIVTGAMASKALYIYKVDSSDKVVQSSGMSNASTFYKNGYVESPWSHNQGLGTLWPYTVMQYDKAKDEYTFAYSLDSWDKSANPKGFKGEGFPDDIDVSMTGVVYFISNSVSGEKSTCDYYDYVRWFNSWNQCSPKLNINFESFSEANVKKYVPDFQKAETHSYIGKGYVDANDVLNLRKSASTDSSVLAKIPKNTKLELYNSGDSNWYFTSYKGVDGFVSADWVKLGEPPAVKPSTINNLSPYLKGQISSGGLKIEGYTTDYVCYGGEKTVQWICEDTWHITAKRKTFSYGLDWYECWDTDDGDYYGWIDGQFLYFYR
ncbi:TIR domain-containing protein [Ruminococcus sp. HUN007]|uniref:TIR domain-containing protein n=1 Tax=Ruminococcus sp. HUN007 TaxID=1514668 RepID=UPI0005D2214E|nr:TIR domain-containing protein [Ruminococcus sp. HUN007]